MAGLNYLRENIETVINQYDIPGQPKGTTNFKFKSKNNWIKRVLSFFGFGFDNNKDKPHIEVLKAAPATAPAAAPSACDNDELIAVIVAAISALEEGKGYVCKESTIIIDGIPRFKKTVPDIYPLIIKYSIEKGIEETELYKKAWIQRAGFSKIRSMKKTGYKPSKSTVICLCLALKLTLTETLNMLQVLGYTLSNDIMVDKIVAWCLEQNQYELEAIDEIIKENDGEYMLIPYCG